MKYSIKIWLAILLFSSSIQAELPEYLTFNITPEGQPSEIVQLYKHTLRSENFEYVGWNPETHTKNGGYYKKSYKPPIRTYRGSIQGNPNVRVFMYIDSENVAHINAMSDKNWVWKKLQHNLNDLLANSVSAEYKLATKVFVPTLNRIKVRKRKPAQLTQTANSTAPGVPSYWKPIFNQPDGDGMQSLPSALEIRYKYALQGEMDAVARTEHDLNQLDYMTARDGKVSSALNVIVIREAIDEGTLYPLDFYGAVFKSEWNNSAFLRKNYDWAQVYALGSGNAGGSPVERSAAAAGSVLHEGCHNWGGDHATYAHDVMSPGQPYMGPLVIGEMMYLRNSIVNTTTNTALYPRTVAYKEPLAPYSLLDMASTPVNTAIDIPVLENDYDSKNLHFQIHTFSETTRIGGTVSKHPGGVLRYTPPLDYTGKDLIVYEIINSDGMSSSNLVFIETVNTNLTFHYTFEKKQGRAAKDHSRNKHDGRLMEGDFSTHTIPGIIGQAVVPTKGLIADPTRIMPTEITLIDGDLEGRGDLIPGPFNLSMETGNHFDPMAGNYTLMFWFKRLGKMEGTLSLANKTWKANPTGYRIGLTEDKVTLHLREFEAQKIPSSTEWNHESIVGATWYHVAMVIDRNSISNAAHLYVNGVKATESIPLDTGSFIFHGRMPLTFGKDAAGRLAFDDAKLYTRALSDAEIRSEVAPIKFPASFPQPALGEVGISSAEPLRLSWKDPNTNAASFKLYFSTNKTEVLNRKTTTLQTTTATTEFTISTLEAGTPYYWCVDKILTDQSRISGDVWGFETRKLRSSLMDGLQSWWGFNEPLEAPTLFDTISGKQAALITPVTRASTGIIGNALNFPHYNNGEISLGAGLQPSREMSLSIWFRQWKNQGTAPVKIGSAYQVKTYKWPKIILNDGKGSTVGLSDRFIIPESANKIGDYSWHHLVFTRKDTKAKVYLDNRLIASRDLPANMELPLGGGIKLGKYMGQVDEVMIWKRALSNSDRFLLSEDYLKVVKFSHYLNLPGNNISNLTSSRAYKNNKPDRVTYNSRMELFSTTGKNFGVVMESIFSPPRTGNYTFRYETVKSKNGSSEIYINTQGTANTNLTLVASKLLTEPVKVTLVEGKSYYVRSLTKVGDHTEKKSEIEFQFSGPDEAELLSMTSDGSDIKSSVFAYPFLRSADDRSANKSPEIMSDPVKKILKISDSETSTYTFSLRDHVYDADRLDELTFAKKSQRKLPWLAITPAGTVTVKISSEHLGRHTVPITVTDGENETITFKLALMINLNTPPQWTTDALSFNHPYNRTQSISLKPYAYDPDPAEFLVFSSNNQNKWVGTINPEGMLEIKRRGNEATGTKDLLAIVTDLSGEHASAPVSIVYLPFNHPPVWRANTLLLSSAAYGQPYRNDLSRHVFDKENDALTFAKISGPEWISCTPNGRLTGTPPAGSSEDHQDDEINNNIVVSANDGYGGVEVTLLLDVENTATETQGAVVFSSEELPPFATHDYLAASKEDTPQFILISDLLSNDLDPRDYTLGIATFSDGKNGTVHKKKNNKLVYKPDPNFFGSDQFTYSITNQVGLINTANVYLEITSVNDAPIASNIITNVIPGEILFLKLGSDVETPEDDLVVTLTTSLTPKGTTVKPGFKAPRRTRIQPATDFTGFDDITYIISDPEGLSTTGTVTLVGPNSTPIAENFGPIEIMQGERAIKDLHEISSDEETHSTNLLYRVIGGSTLGNNAWLNKKHIARLRGDHLGKDRFQYTVTDEYGSSATGTISVVITSIINTPPTILRDGELKTTGGRPDSIDLRDLVSDTETANADLTFSLEYGFSVQGLKLWNPSIHEVEIRPPVSFFGTDSFNYIVNDGELSENGTVNITVAAADVTAGIIPAWDLLEVPVTDVAPRGDVLDFDGIGGVDVPSRKEINLLPVTNRTWSIWFNAKTVINRQVLYEQGGGSRGVNIYLVDGQLVCGIWGMTSAADYYRINKPINAGTWYHVAIVLDGDNSIVTTYLNGEKSKGDPAVGGLLKIHQGGIGIGHVGLDGGDGKTMFSDGSSFRDNQYEGFRYTGYLDDLRMYDSALNANEVERIYNAPAQ